LESSLPSASPRSWRPADTRRSNCASAVRFTRPSSSANDLIGDILSPPAYVIESYFEATLALRDPSTVAARRERLLPALEKKDVVTAEAAYAKLAAPCAAHRAVIDESRPPTRTPPWKPRLPRR